MSSFHTLRRNHDFTVLWVGQTVSDLGSHVSMFVYPLLGYGLTGSVLLASLAEALQLLGLASALLPAGVLADSHDRRRLMRWASGSGVLLYASLVLAAAFGHLTFVHLCVAALLTGAGAGLFAPAESSAVRAVVPTDELPTALSQNQARQHVAALVGGPLGGVLYGLARALPFAFDAVSYAVSWLMLGRIRADLSAPAGVARRRPLEQAREGFVWIRSRPFFRVLLVWAPLANLTVNAVFTVVILRLVQDGVAPATIGLVDAAAGSSGIAGALIAPWIIDRVPTGLLTVLVAWSFAPLLVPLIFFDDPVVVAAAISLGLLLNPAGNAGIGSYRVAVTPHDLQGRVQSALALASMSTMPVAALLGGLALSVLGGAAAVALLAVAVALVALIPTLSRSVRAVPRPSQWVLTEQTTPAPTV